MLAGTCAPGQTVSLPVLSPPAAGNGSAAGSPASFFARQLSPGQSALPQSFGELISCQLADTPRQKVILMCMLQHSETVARLYILERKLEAAQCIDVAG